MTIQRKPKFIYGLFSILDYIKKDKISPANKFEKELNKKLNLLKLNPFMCQISKYFNDENYRDLIYKGYTIIYKIQEDEILVLEIFKWQDKI